MRWIRGLVPVAAMALVSAGAMVHPPALGAVARAWQPPPCAGSGPPDRMDPAAAPSWYRLEGVLDESGTLAGRRLVFGAGTESGAAVDLPPESFATGPRNGWVLVGEDDGKTSRLSMLDVAGRCVRLVAQERAVVRSAVFAADGRAIWEHRVDRRTRADRGVWLRPLDGRPSVRRLAALAADPRYGRTFSTELRIASDGRLAVTACGEHECRTRLLDPSSDRIRNVGPTGGVVGVAADGVLIAHGACAGYPCPLVAHAPDGAPTVIVPRAGRAALSGTRLVFETAPGRLAALDLGTGDLTVVDGTDLVPVPDGSRASAGAEHRAPGVLVATGGRMDGGALVVPVRGSTTPRTLGEGAR